jgi:hypothetical protein
MIRHVGYKHGKQEDPQRRLLAAVVVRAVLDADPTRKVKAYHRETARLFLAGAEGQAFLQAFGIPPHKAQNFINNNYQLR